jgi:serine/threonine-protein kinase
MDAAVGRYRVVGRVGEGSTGTVYLGYDADLDRPVAIKELSPALAGDPAFVDRFRREGQVMARLDHPNCIRVYELVEQPGREYLVSEFVNGASLREVVNRGRLTPEQALGVLHGALLGLAHAHALGLVHRDIKPDNVMCDATGESKLGDFGLAAPAGDSEAGAAAGTPTYMSPEQARGEAVDARGDVYSAGAMLFELLEGHPPFTGDSAPAVMRQQVETAPPAMSTGTPPAVEALVRRALAKVPAERPDGAAAFAEELEQAATAAYGPDWRKRAGIAEVVSAAVAAGAAAAGTLATAVASGALSGASTGVATVAGGAVTGAAGATGGGKVAPPGAPTPPVQRPPSSQPPSPKPGGGGPLLRSRRVQVVAAVVVLVLLAGAGAGALALRRPAPTPPAAALDACVVGNWTSTQDYFLFHDSDINLDTHLIGGAGVRLSIAADGSSVTDMNASTTFTGDNGGHHYTVLERGRSAGSVATTGDTLTVTPGQKLEGLAFVADRDGSPWGGGTPEVARLATSGSSIKRTCASDTLTLADGPYQTIYKRASAGAPAASPSPCTGPAADTTMSLCPGRVAPGEVIDVHSLASCFPPGQPVPTSLSQPSVALFVSPKARRGGLASILVRLTFPLDSSGNWSGRMMIDPYAKIAPGTYTLSGACFDAGVNVQNGFGIPYGPVDFELTAG